MKIDIYTHIVPEKYKAALAKKAPHLESHLARVPTLFDLGHRFRVMDEFKDVKQVVTLAMTAGLVLDDPGLAVDFARLANDETAEIVARYPDRFAAGVASVPLTDMDAAVQELDRAIGKLKLKGLQLLASVSNKPLDLRELMPLFEKMAAYDLPVWIFPARSLDRSSYQHYLMDVVFGWPYESTAVMTHLALEGLFERFPGIKILIHHCGALVPFFTHRIAEIDEASSLLQGMSAAGRLNRPLIDYLKMFYADTALSGNAAGLMCGRAFYAADHLLFGTDMPYDNKLGALNTRETIRSIEEMTIPDAEKRMIYADNAQRLLRL